MADKKIDEAMQARFAKAASRDVQDKIEAVIRGVYIYGEGNFVVCRDEDGFWTTMEKADDDAT
jgi:hypothetical protein